MNWYNNIKTAQLSHSIKKRIVGGAIAGSLATAALLALKATNPDAYQKVQNKEITIQVAAKNEVNNNFFIQEIIRVHHKFRLIELLKIY